jgi:hypothetical protein
MNAKLRRGLLSGAVHAALAASALTLAGVAGADGYPEGNAYGYYGQKGSQTTPYPSQMAAITAEGWGDRPLFTIGESVGDYTPPGIPDGMYAWKRGRQVKVLVNHELTASSGYPYTLASGAELTGARVSYFDIDRTTRRVTDAGPAYDTIYNRAGAVVMSSADLEFGGLNRLCSASGVEAWSLGFVDDIFFTGEETGGGTEFALDVKRGELWAVPAMGRAAWESAAAIEPPSHRHVALVVGDDRSSHADGAGGRRTGAPLLLYVGKKQGGWRRHRGAGFLERNGLAQGKLYAWVADNGAEAPADFNGTGSTLSGTFVELDYHRPDLAGNGEYDDLGYATQDKQDALAAAVGALGFSRPEDVGTNPANGYQFAFASTGNGFGGPADLWGTTYQVDVSYGWNGTELVPTGVVRILYDGDDAGNQDAGLRSPDNLAWATNGMIYVQEDRSVGGFGLTSGHEASVFELNPWTGDLNRIAEMDRGAVAPVGVVDNDPTDVGDWESSGVIDVTPLFDTEPGEVLLLANTQAHSVSGGVITDEDLVQGGQLLFLNFWGGIEE